jgi:hypothetical protein
MFKNETLAICTLTVCGVVCGFAHGQSVREWANAQSGDWNLVQSWSPADVPDSIQEIARLGHLTPYTVTIGALQNFTVNRLEIRNSAAVLAMLAPSVNGFTELVVKSGVENNGTIRIGGGSTTNRASRLTLAGNSQIAGTGAMVLEAGTGMLQIDSASNVLHAASHRITGTGLIGVAGVFVNEGSIVADVPGARLSIGNVTNRGTIKSINSGIGRLTGIVTQEDAGTIFAESGSVELANATLIGGYVGRPASGVIEVPPNAYCVVDGVTALGEWRVYGGNATGASRLRIKSGGLVNNGLIRVLVGSTNARQGLDFIENTTLTGNGTVRLEEIEHAQFVALAGVTVLIGEGQVVEGRGFVRAEKDGNVINEGLIHANVKDLYMELTNITNRSLILVSNDSMAQVSNVTQEDGVIRADNGVLQLRAGRIKGGFIDTINGGIVEIPPGYNQVVDGVSGSGSWFIRNGTNANNAELRIESGGFRLDGLLRIPTGVTTREQRVVFTQSATFSGNAEIRLEEALDSQVYVVSGAVGTIEREVRVTGTGVIMAEAGGTLLNRGTISPGLPYGTMLFQNVVQDASGTIELEIGGTTAAQRDQITSQESLALAGTLRVHFRNGFVPTPCTQYPLITGGSISGSFHTVELPVMPRGTMAVRISSGAVTLVYLHADHDYSGQVDQADYEQFVSDFELGLDAADFDGSGFVDTDDFTAFALAFAGTC